LEGQSKATGVSMSSLVSIAQQFDTFEGAATAAGKLNAILGGGVLNSVELLNASEAERIRLLREGVASSGRSFTSLSKYEKMAVANAAGISDMSEAARIFGTSDKDFLRVQKAQEAEAMSVATLTEHAQHATSAQEKMQLAIQGVSGAALPLVNIINRLLNFVLRVNDALGGVFVPIVVGAIVSIVLFTKAVQGMIAAKAVLTTVTTALTGSKAAETAATAAHTTVVGIDSYSNT